MLPWQQAGIKCFFYVLFQSRFVLFKQMIFMYFMVLIFVWVNYNNRVITVQMYRCKCVWSPGGGAAD